MEQQEDHLSFCVVDVSCDYCNKPGPYYHLTQDPKDGSDWPRLHVFCEQCLRDLHAAIADQIRTIDFRRGVGI